MNKKSRRIMHNFPGWARSPVARVLGRSDAANYRGKQSWRIRDATSHCQVVDEILRWRMCAVTRNALCTPHMHTSYAYLICTPYMHYAHLICTPHIPIQANMLSTPKPFTLPKYVANKNYWTHSGKRNSASASAQPQV